VTSEPESVIDGGVSPGPFVGRTAELAKLETSLGNALHGGGRVILVAGDPGIGKTRLAKEVAGRAVPQGFTVLWGRCWDSGGAPSFWPWVQALRGYARRTGEPGPGAASATPPDPRLPELARLIGIDSSAGFPTLDPDQMRFRLFDATVTFLRAAAVERPLLLILDDLHAADADSLLLLRFLARGLTDIRLLVIGTYRDADARSRPEIGTLLEEVAREALSLHLRGWSEPEVTQFMVTGVGSASTGLAVSTELGGAVSRVTEGNPLFVEEIVRLWNAEGRPPEVPAQGQVEVRIPDSVRAAVRQRLVLLPTPSRDALGVAAVIGREFDVAVLSRVIGTQPESGVRDLLDGAVNAAIIAELPTPLGFYTFSHILIRDTLYHDHSPSRRAALHHAVARAIEMVHAATLDAHLADLAHHYVAAVADGTAAQALQYSLQAAERATVNCAYADAVSHRECALEVATRLSDSDPQAAQPRRCELLLGLGESQNMAGKRREARETFRHAADLARALQLPEALARAGLGYGGLWGGPEELLKFSSADPGHFDDTLARLLSEARDLLGARNPALRARLLSRLAIELYFTATPAQREVLTHDAMTIARRLDDPPTLAVVLWDCHAAVWGPDSVSARRAMAEEIVEVAERIGDYGLELGGRAWLIGDLLELGDGQRVQVEFERFRRLAESYRQPIHLWGLKSCLAQHALLVGDFDQVPALAGEALSLGLTLFAGAFIAYGVQMSSLYRERGQFDELRATETGLRGFIERYPDLPHPRVALAHILVLTGCRDEARTEFDRLAAHNFEDLPRDVGWSSAMVELTEVCAALGDTRRAGALYRLLLPCVAYVAVSPFHAMCWGAMARSLGVLAGMLEDWTAAEAHFAVALTCNRRLNARPWVARTQYDWATMLCARTQPGDAGRARALLDEALATADALGMRPLLQRIGELAARLTSATADPAPRPVSLAPNRFAHDGDLWNIAYAGQSCSLKDARGLSFLAMLLRHPRHEFHALELVQLAGEAADSDSPGAAADTLGALGGSDTGPILDAQGRAIYKRRLVELRAELAAAQSCHDPGRVERAHTEIDSLTQELARAFGLGGRGRRSGSNAERARVNVTRAIAATLKKISARNPDLGRHLAETIRTGTFCAYKPDSRVPIVWDVVS